MWKLLVHITWRKYEPWYKRNVQYSSATWRRETGNIQRIFCVRTAGDTEVRVLHN